MASTGRLEAEDRRFWSRRVSLTTRILAVNIIALGLLAGSFFYLDSYRKQLLQERFNLARTEVEIAADALAGARAEQRRAILRAVGTRQHLRLRLFAANGKLIADSFELAPPSFAFIDPDKEPWYQHTARALDRGMDFLLGADPILAYRELGNKASDWPEIVQALQTRRTTIFHRAAPDQTPVITAASPVGGKGEALLVLRNAPDVTQNVRDARQTLAIVVAVAAIISVQLSLFLARTIVQPLRMLVRSAIRVRLGRDRNVIVPRLPDRRDEIGLLARAISDMTMALRQRIDAVDTFAADVAHEIKNPLASLRSALEALDKVADPGLRKQLSEIAAHDIRRIDRLITEISEVSRIDAELSRTAFQPVDLAALAKGIIANRDKSGANHDRRIVLRLTGDDDGGDDGRVTPGNPPRLERVLENLLDNAVSFSAPGGTVTVEIARQDERIQVSVQDEGPGIAPKDRERIFERFHSLRPEDEDFGGHSGLGLAIARTIIEAHDGKLIAQDRGDQLPGACLMFDLPAYGEFE